jgi:hypothetical protein
VPETSAPKVDGLEAAADQAIATCGGDAREAVTALIVASNFLEAQFAKVRAAVSSGYARGRFDPPPAIGRRELMSEVTYYVALPFVVADDGIAPGRADRVIQSERRRDAC